MTRQPILLIGGSGFVGISLTRRLQSEGHEVHWLVRHTTNHAVTGVVVHPGGLGNVELLRRILGNYGTIFHLASGTTPGTSASDPSLEAEMNLFPTLRFLEVLQQQPPSHLIFLSSGGTVYGDPASTPVAESATPSPISYYGAGKVAIESFLNIYARTFSRRVTILRPSNLYGPRQPFYHGFGVIRTMLQHVIADTVMPVWGDGTTTRDFLYIDDFMDACKMALQPSFPAGTYNVGSGAGHSLLQLHGLVEASTGRKLRLEHHPRRPLDVRSVVLDFSLFHDRTGWLPSTSLAAGIAATWRWLRGHA